MTKVLVVNISSTAKIDDIKDKNYSSEFELTELNKHLAEGWAIFKYDIVPNNYTTSTFSVIYQLVK